MHQRVDSEAVLVHFLLLDIGERMGAEFLEGGSRVMGIFKRHKKKKGMGIGLADHMASSRLSNQQDSPEPERVTRQDEEAGMSVRQLKDPPQAEG
ncbi:MAG TPA: hypothetical protein VF021_05085 [Longimicrobiales bacterium]